MHVVCALALWTEACITCRARLTCGGVKRRSVGACRALLASEVASASGAVDMAVPRFTLAAEAPHVYCVGWATGALGGACSAEGCPTTRLALLQGGGLGYSGKGP